MVISGADMDVCLHQFGQCNFVSAKQACIFFDEVTLLSYSLSSPSIKVRLTRRTRNRDRFGWFCAVPVESAAKIKRNVCRKWTPKLSPKRSAVNGNISFQSEMTFACMNTTLKPNSMRPGVTTWWGVVTVGVVDDATLWTTQLQRARHDGRQRPLLVRLLGQVKQRRVADEQRRGQRAQTHRERKEQGGRCADSLSGQGTHELQNKRGMSCY